MNFVFILFILLIAPLLSLSLFLYTRQLNCECGRLYTLLGTFHSLLSFFFFFLFECNRSNLALSDTFLLLCRFLLLLQFSHPTDRFLITLRLSLYHPLPTQQRQRPTHMVPAHTTLY